MSTDHDDGNGTSLSFEEVQGLFETLGIKTFGAALPEGQIHWLDAAGAVVAHGRCEAILSYASNNDSVMWAARIPQLIEAGVPTVAPEAEVPDYMEDMEEHHAQALAADAARRAGAQFLYAAPTGNGALYLAIFEFTPGGLADNPMLVAHRESDARRLVFQGLSRAAKALEAEGAEAEAAELLGGLARTLRQQATFVLKGLAMGEQVEAMAGTAEGWQKVLPGGRETVLAEIKAIAGEWR